MHYLINPRQVKNFEILTFHPSLMSLPPFPQACSSIISASRKSSETNTLKMVFILSPLQIKKKKTNKQAVSNGNQTQLTNASLGMREYVSPPVHPLLLPTPQQLRLKTPRKRKPKLDFSYWINVCFLERNGTFHRIPASLFVQVLLWKQQHCRAQNCKKLKIWKEKKNKPNRIILPIPIKIWELGIETERKVLGKEKENVRIDKARRQQCAVAMKRNQTVLSDAHSRNANNQKMHLC